MTVVCAMLLAKAPPGVKAKNTFFEDLQDTLDKDQDRLVLLGDFNARVGVQSDNLWQGDWEVMGWMSVTRLEGIAGVFLCKSVVRYEYMVSKEIFQVWYMDASS